MKVTLVAILTRLHYRLMANRRYWYQVGLKNADGFVCRVASDLRAGKFSIVETWKRARWSFAVEIFRELAR